MYSRTLSLTSVLDAVGGQLHAPAALPRERPGTHCIGGLLRPRTDLDRYEKTRIHRGFDPPDRGACSESQYRLHYPGTPFVLQLTHNKVKHTQL